MAECWCDYERPSFFREGMRKVRKRHHCYECGGAIYPGQEAMYTVGKWEGQLSNHYTCKHCLEIRQYTQAHVPCFCWYYGSMLDDATETIRHWAHEAPGLLFGFYRRLIQGRRIRKAVSR